VVDVEDMGRWSGVRDGCEENEWDRVVTRLLTSDKWRDEDTRVRDLE